ncbi:MAG TPA: GGDEF domain-containing protein [Vicinamibacterales bacterium]
MTTRPIELGLNRGDSDDAPGAGQIQLLASIVSSIARWSADHESPRTRDFRTRLERLHRNIVPGITADDLQDVIERVLELCDTYFQDTRTVLVERERELTSLVQVLRDTLADLAGQAKTFNVDLLRSTDRISQLANLDDIRELKRQVASEARDLKNAVIEKQRRDDVLFMQMSKRVDALQMQLAEAQRQAEQDPLTSIANRRGFDRTLREWTALANRTRKPFSLAIVDIDDFKRINDTHGHQVGDRVLLCLAQHLTEAAAEGDFVARHGGEEFAVLMRHTGLDAAVERMEASLRRIASHEYNYQQSGREERLTFTCSAGVAEFSPGETGDDLLKRADRALYEAKRSGKNRAIGRKKGLLAFLGWPRTAAL